MASSTYTDAKVIAASKMYVNVISHSETGHGTREVIVNGREKQTWCLEYWGIPCEVHVEGAKAVGNFMKGSYGTPTTIICDPEGKEIFRKAGAMGGSELVKAMTENLAKVPGEHISAVEWSAAKKTIADSDKLVEKGDFKKAIEALVKISKSKVKALAELAAEPLKAVEEKGKALLEEAKGKIESEKAEAKKAISKIASDFKPLEVAKEAAELLKTLKD